MNLRPSACRAGTMTLPHLQIQNPITRVLGALPGTSPLCPHQKTARLTKLSSGPTGSSSTLSKMAVWSKRVAGLQFKMCSQIPEMWLPYRVRKNYLLREKRWTWSLIPYNGGIPIIARENSLLLSLPCLKPSFLKYHFSDTSYFCSSTQRIAGISHFCRLGLLPHRAFKAILILVQ